MNSLFIAIRLVLLCILLTACNSAPGRDEAARPPVSAFELSEVTLLDGPFKHATELNVKSLLNYDPDRLLSKFRSEAGLQPKAPPYEGWEAQTIAGHSLGHHLSACALMYQTTQDERFLERARYIVDELEACQVADGDGYIGAFPNGKRILEDEVAKGDIRSQGFDLNGIWVPYYTEHKVLAGLRDAYRLCGVTKALTVAERFADWLGGVVENLDDEQIQTMLGCEHGGINEVLVDLNADTKNEKYLALSRVFHHKAILDSLAAGYDILPNKHGNTQIPKLIGVARRYELTGDLNDKNAAEFFWQRVVEHHSYVTGGHGNHEYFGQPDHLRNRLSDETTETCNVYNMLKLTRHLFEWNPRAEVADYYERALFNHILSSQHPADGRVIYNLSLEMGGYKHYQNPEWFTCCIGTGMETHSKYGRNIFYKNSPRGIGNQQSSVDDQFVIPRGSPREITDSKVLSASKPTISRGEHELYVGQFIAAVANWKELGVTITQTTQFPQEQGTMLAIECAEPQEFTLHIRYPYWAEKGIEISVNGEKQNVMQKPGSFVALKRRWASGDKVDIRFPFTLRLEAMPDDENRVAILYGPLVLAGDLGPVDDPSAENADYVPVLFAENRDPNLWLRPVENAANTFEITSEIARPRGFTLKPFYATHERRYSVYWDLFNEQRWQQHQADLQAEIERQKELEQKTLDFFQPGETQPESAHNFTGERIRVVDFRHRKGRVADRGGWFSFEMQVDPTNEMALVIHYWGGFTGSKTFDILIDGEIVATENISGKKDGQFIDIQYDLPPELLASKDKITVRFQPHVGHRAGPFFGARIIAI